MFYVVSAPDPSSWSFDRDALIQLLVRDWPGVRVSGPVPNNAARDVVWVYEDSDGELNGSQHQTGRAQYLEGPLQLIARYVAWWRSNVPDQNPLILYDEAFTTVIPVAPEADAQTLLDALTL